MTDPAISGTSRFGPAGGSGLHQVVVAGGASTENYGGFDLDPGGPHVIPWTGGGLTAPSVMQDTDGYSGTVGTMVDGGIITALSIPPALGGDYRAGIESVNLESAWFSMSSAAYPHDVPYVPSHVPGINGRGVCEAGLSVEWAFYVNGVKIASSTWISSGVGGFHYQTPTGNVEFASIALAAGDSVTSTVEWIGGTWPLANFGNAYTAWGSFCVMYLTRISGGGGKQFLRGHVAL